MKMTQLRKTPGFKSFKYVGSQKAIKARDIAGSGTNSAILVANGTIGNSEPSSASRRSFEIIQWRAALGRMIVTRDSTRLVITTSNAATTTVAAVAIIRRFRVISPISMLSISGTASEGTNF